MNLVALIVAGGTGNRMKSDVPKQFMLLNNKPVLMHTINRFTDFNPAIRIILVLPQTQFTTWNNLCQKYHFKTEHQLVEGGNDRFWSVKNGLENLSEDGIVFIHDGVRPMVSFETIQRCMNTAAQKGNAIPVLALTESIRKVTKGSNKAEDRSSFVSIQTPQVFQIKLIKKAYNLGYHPIFTDDSTVLEQSGLKINLVKGNRENLKITHPIDLKIAEALWKTFIND